MLRLSCVTNIGQYTMSDKPNLRAPFKLTRTCFLRTQESISNKGKLFKSVKGDTANYLFHNKEEK